MTQRELQMSPPPSGELGRAVPFAALRHPNYRAYFVTNILTMMGDNIEHVISYWVVFHTFHSPFLGGYAVISHWMPFLLFSVWAGSLADRFDCRRLLQLSMALFAAASLAWGILFLTDTLQVWHAMVILTIHGFAGVFWGPAGQLILHDVVGREHLQSAIRLTSTGRRLGLLLGPGVGGALMLAFGPAVGLLVNALAYAPLAIWALAVPHTGHAEERAPRSGGGGLADIVRLLRELSANRPLVAMIGLAGCTALLVGNAFQAQMPEFAEGFGPEDPGRYAVLQTAQAAGAVAGGVLLESVGLLRPRAETAIVCGALFGVAALAFAGAPSYVVAVGVLVLVGMLRLAFSAMAQTLVQLLAPSDVRGRTVGAYHMAQAGLQVGSGFTVGLVGGFIGIHWALALSAFALIVADVGLLLFVRRGRKTDSSRPAASVDAS